MKPILNQDLFFVGEIRLSDNVYDPDTQEIRWPKDKRLAWNDIIEMLKIGIDEIPVYSD